MKKTKPVKRRPPRKPAFLADVEIAHLDRATKEFEAIPNKRRLGCLDRAYWHKRIATLKIEFDLVPEQRSRLSRLIDRLDSTGPEAGYTAKIAA